MSQTISLNPYKINNAERIYAIGDIHGFADILKKMHSRIFDDLNQHPVERASIIHLGDYINRGPESRGVIEYLIESGKDIDGVQIINLFGNHENAILEFVDDPEGKNRDWYAWPHHSFLQNYDIDPEIKAAEKLAAILADTVPQSHWDFLKNLPYYHINKDLLFVHNGPRPGIQLEKQTKEDLVNNREPFMSCEDPHEYFVVHGHTSTKDFQIDCKPNRLNLDTGLFYPNGQLTCGVFEGCDVRFIQIQNPN